jgi:molybdenum cofactor sulfurtransferase
VVEKDGGAWSTFPSSSAESFLSSLKNTMVSYPAQCNATGTRYPLSWASLPNNSNYAFLDTASYCSTSAIDLPASIDFCCLSFYKMFGFPTGVGALIAKTSSLEALFSKSYFGGGTVEGLNQIGWTQMRQGHEKWEDGTLPFLEILAIGHGFDYIEGCGGWKSVEESVGDIARYAKSRMKGLRHASGGDVVVVYEGEYETGPIICFNVKSGDGAWI